MNWEAIGAVGDIIAAIAVVVSLIYLAVQVQRGTNATHAASIQAAVAMDQEFLLTLGSDPATAQLWASYLSNPEALSSEQKVQAHFLMGSLLRRLENIQSQHRLGTLSQAGWMSRQNMFNVIARSRGYSAFLDSPIASFLNAQFIEYMARLKTGK